MTLFQLGIDLVPAPASVSELLGAPWVAPVFWGLGLIFAFALCAFLGIKSLRRRFQMHAGTFDKVTLLVTLPKFRHESESTQAGSKDQVGEAIAAAETFFSALGGRTEESGLKAWLFGRADEVAFQEVGFFQTPRFFFYL